MGSSGQTDGLAPFLTSNRAWASKITEQDPEYFKNLSKGQSPHILWIGCSDSRIPETTILGLKPGDVFVHRNIANVITATDLSCVSVVEFAVKNLKVQHVVVCGHTSCGGVAGALGNKAIGKIDTWLQPLRHLRMQNADAIQQLDDKEKGNLLAELNVKQGVEILRQNPDVMEAAISRNLQVHGLVFDLSCGELKSVDTNVPESVAERRKAAFDVS